MTKVPFTALLILLSTQGDPLAEVPKLIERLHSPDFQERQEASRLLKEIGPPALPLLEQASKDKDAEVVTRSRDLVRQIRLRLALGPRLLREFPGIDDRLDTPKPRIWTLELFKILDDRWKDGSLKGLLPLDLEPLADRAFAGVQGDEEITRLVKSSSELGLRLAFPSLRRLAESLAGTNPSLADEAMRAMTRVDPPNALPVLLGSLKPQNAMRVQVLQVLKIRPGSVKVVEAVRPLLKDPDASVRSEAAMLLGTALDIPSSGAIETLLRDRGPEVRTAALLALQRLAAKRSSAPVRLLLKDANEDVQREAIKTLAVLDAVEAAPEIEALARKTKDKWTQGAAAEALGFLGRREAIATLVALSKSPEREVLRPVLGALFRLGARAEATALARTLLKSKDVELIKAGAECLGNMGVQESVDAIVDAVPGCPPEALPALVRTLWDLADPKAVPALQTLLEDKATDPFGPVRSALARIKATGEAPVARAPSKKDPEAFLKALEDPQARVRAEALLDLWILKVPVPEDRLTGLLSDSDGGVRKYALRLARQQGGAAFLPRIRSLVKDESALVVYEALEGLASLGELTDLIALRSRINEFLPALAVCRGLAARRDGLFQDLLEELLLNEQGDFRHRAGDILCRRGSSLGVAAVLAAGSGFFSLNALRAPDRYKLLATRPSVGPHEGTARELLDRAGKVGGFQVDIPSPLPHMGLPWWDCPWPMSPRWKRDTLLDDVTSALNELYNGVGPYEAVLDGDHVKILPPEDAKLFWQRWWGNLKK